MPRFFTYCWQHREMLRHPSGEPVGFAYGSQFSRRGVCPNVQVYIVSGHRGQVYLLGKMLLRAVTFMADDFRRFVGQEPETAREYLIADECTPGQLLRVSEETTCRLRFIRAKQPVGLSLDEHGRVDRQGLRGVRKLTPESAALLDKLLPAMALFRPVIPVIAKPC